MFTPQEIQEQTFSKAVFGGYDMQQVDDFLEPLTEDYITLYKENAVLKSKMKILVEKLEEYRAQEGAMKKAMANAQATCDQMVAETQAKCAAMMNDAQGSVRSQTADLQQSLAEEEERIRCAKQTAINFIEVIESDIKGHLDLLQTLKSRDLRAEAEAQSAPPAPRAKPYDWQADSGVSAVPDFVVPAAPVQPAAQSAGDIASEISENLEKLVGSDPVEQTPAAKPAQQVKPMHPESATIKFTDLKFGKNYDPTSGK